MSYNKKGLFLGALVVGLGAAGLFVFSSGTDTNSTAVTETATEVQANPVPAIAPADAVTTTDDVVTNGTAVTTQGDDAGEVNNNTAK